MAKIRAIVRVQEADSPHIIGTFAALVLTEQVPRAGEYLQLGTFMARIQDVVWICDGSEVTEIDLIMPTQRSMYTDVEVLGDLQDNGFVPLNSEGQEQTWDSFAIPVADPEEVL